MPASVARPSTGRWHRRMSTPTCRRAAVVHDRPSGPRWIEFSAQAAPRRQADRQQRGAAPARSASRSRWRSSPPTPSRPPPTRPRRSSSSCWRRSTFPTSHSYLVPIAIVAVVLLAIVVTSYRQTIFAYPTAAAPTSSAGRTSAPTPALVAGASLLVDYILTVAVSIVGRRARHPLGVPLRRPRRLPRRLCLGFLVPHDARQPARHQGVGPDLRGADLPLHRLLLVAADRLGLVRVFGFQTSARSPASEATPTSSPSEHGAARRARRRCSSCCGRSRRAPSRSPASRRSPTACPRSSKPESKNAATHARR